MSCYEWEHGTITLPSAAVAPLKKALREQHNQKVTAVTAQAKNWHRKHTTRSRDVYEKRMVSARLDCHVECILRQMLRRTKSAPVTPTQADAAAARFTRATNRTTYFPVYDDQGYEAGSITFDGRNVTWSVDENNHAVEHAHDGPTGTLFFSMLERVSFTRGAGGVIVGNDEYTRDDTEPGGGGNYITHRYGPLGKHTDSWR